MISSDIYNEYLTALLKGDRRTCTRIVTSLLDSQIEITTLYTDLFQKSLYEVGRLWERNKISVAREHLSTAITEGLMNLVYPRLFSGPSLGKKIIIACTADEYHQVGGKMVADIFQSLGWDSHFLGANTPVDDLLSHIDEVRPNLVGLSLSVFFNLARLKAAIEAVNSTFTGLDLLVGGQAFVWGGTQVFRQYPHVGYVPSINELKKRYSS